MFKPRSLLFLAAFAALIGLLGAACGNDESADGTGTPGATAAASSAETPSGAAPVEPTTPASDEPVAGPAPAEAPATSSTTTTAVEKPPTPATATTSGAGAAATTSTTAPVEAGDGTASSTATPETTRSMDDAESAAGFPVTIRSDGGTWTLESAPQRIVSLSPAATEILFAIGAGDQVVAVDSWSYYPPEAPVTDMSGFDPNIEAVAAYEPDLVVLAFDTNDLVAGLTALDIPALLRAGPLDIEGGYAAVTELGLATGHTTEAEDVIATMRSEISTALAGAPEVPVRIYHELDQTYFSASSDSFIGAVYTALGVENIADDADPEGYGYPQLTEEYIIEADPELIVITDLTGYTADDVATRPGWESISAVRNGNIIVVDADIASRWGPRLPQFVGAIAEALTAVAAPAAESVG